MQDTGVLRNTIDQFYTHSEVAAECIAELRKYAIGQWIEPSAGTGSFLVEGAIGMDIEPKADGILTQNFLTWQSPYMGCTVYGNPPFGRQSKLARQFIKHAATFADIIAFILPRSFTKPSMQKAFPLKFHLLSELIIRDNAFIVNGKPYNVPCVFQIWRRREINRTIEPELLCPWDYVKKSDDYDVAIRRVGVNAGRCLLPDDELSAQSHYFVKFPYEFDTDDLIEFMNNHEFPSNTTGPRSLSKFEINCALHEYADLIHE